LLNGTKKLFPTDYHIFKEAMIAAAEEDSLPVVLELKDIKNFTLNDFEETFFEFQKDTGLDITGSMAICPDCGRLHVFVEVDYPEEEEENTLWQ